jgi:hypothetical protein
MFSNFGNVGLTTNIVINAIIVGWIIYSYHVCFQKAAEKHGLKYPIIFY